MIADEIENSVNPDTEVILSNKVKQLEGLNQMIAHNLRGSGANIKMLAEVLLNKNIAEDCQVNGDDDVFTINEAIQYIHESSSSLLNTLSTLLEIANIDLNERVKYDECDIAAIVEHVVNQLHGFIQQKNATIEHSLSITQGV